MEILMLVFIVVATLIFRGLLHNAIDITPALLLAVPVCGMFLMFFIIGMPDPRKSPSLEVSMVSDTLHMDGLQLKFSEPKCMNVKVWNSWFLLHPNTIRVEMHDNTPECASNPTKLIVENKQ